ncbi:MAG: DUF433 domain-containing protein [Acidobacteriota bacterium]
MRLEDYFDFVGPNDIRIKGTRVGIENVLYEHVHRGRTPEDIVAGYPSVTLEQVHATITYYLHNREQVARYIADWLETGRRRREEQERNPTPAMLRLRRVAEERLIEGAHHP